jgi:predicted TIM-barrel fold metal-dependent hydrolase
MATMPVIDFHVHVARPEDYHPWVLEWMQSLLKESSLEKFRRLMTPPGLLSIMDDCGVSKAVVLADMHPKTVGLVTNEFVTEFCCASDRLIPFACVNPHLVSSPREELRRCLDKLGMRGLKLAPTYAHFYPNDTSLYPMYALAEERRIPVMFHTGSSVFKGSKIKFGEPVLLDDVAVDFPDMTILLVHSGRGFWYDQAAFLARLHPNVYMEIAGLPPQKLMTYFPELERLSDKVVFGSDWPGLPSLKKNIDDILALPISDDAKGRILCGNAAHLLGLSAC